MEHSISKSKFKSRSLEYFREVGKTGKTSIIMDHGKPILRILPCFEEPSEVMKMLSSSVIKYEDPTDPVELDDWGYYYLIF